MDHPISVLGGGVAENQGMDGMGGDVVHQLMPALMRPMEYAYVRNAVIRNPIDMMSPVMS